MTWDAVVVGSGIGGLSCAATLAARGRKVLVLEQSGAPGGYLSSFRRGDFVFDAGVDCIAGLDPDGIFIWLLARLGVEGGLRPIRLDPIRLSLFPGLSVRVERDVEAYAERLAELFPRERAGIAAFFRRAGGVYSDTQILMDIARGEARASASFPGSLLRHGDATFSEFVGIDIADARLAAVLADRCPFLGTSPGRVSAIRMVTLMMSYFRSGAFRPAGGHQRLPDLLVEGIRRRGGKFLARTAARRIVLERGRCIGVETDDGEMFPAAHVVSNACPRETFSRLLGGTARVAAEAAGAALSPSFFIVYAAIRGDVPMADAVSSVGSFESFDLDRLFERYVPFRDSATLGITIPSLDDPGLCPPGHHVVLMHELVPQRHAADWKNDKEALAARVLRKAEAILPGLSERLIRLEAATPATLERYTRNRGGAAVGWDQVLALPRIRHGIPNLQLAGHWTETGGGVLAAAYSGVLAASRIAEASR